MFLIQMLLCLCREGTRLKPIEIGLQTNQRIVFASQIIIAHVAFGVMPVTEKMLFIHYREPGA
jgi:hypothetical protein